MSDATKRVPPRFTPETPPGTETHNRSTLATTNDIDLTTHVINDNKTRVQKTLGQSKVAAATLTDLYTVPASTNTEVSVIWATNQSATPTVIRIAFSVAGGAIALKDYIAYDVPIGANETIQFLTPGMMAATDKLRVYATLATVSFSASGTEIS